MKVLIEYETQNEWAVNRRVKVSEIREIDDDCYPRVIGKLLREIHDKGHVMLNIRCLDPHPDDMRECSDEKETNST